MLACAFVSLNACKTGGSGTEAAQVWSEISADDVITQPEAKRLADVLLKTDNMPPWVTSVLTGVGTLAASFLGIKKYVDARHAVLASAMTELANGRNSTAPSIPVT